MPIKLVSEQSEAEITAQRAREAQERAREEALDALVKLTGNLFRIARGAGKPYQVSLSAHEYLEAERALYDLTGKCLQSHEIANALNVLFDRPDPPSGDEEAWERQHAKDLALRGALQIAASRLLDDQLRLRAGERELSEGLRAWEHRPKATKAPRKSPADDIVWRRPPRR